MTREVQNMDAMRIIQDYAKPAYLSVAECAKVYGYSKQTIYSLVKEMRDCKRYKGVWTELNPQGDRLVNTLCLEDFLRYRSQLKEPNLAKSLPPYDPKEVRRPRGELQLVTNFIDDEQVRTYTREFVGEWLAEKFSS